MTNHQEALDGDRLLVETDWLEANLDAPDLRILDCTVFLTTDPAGDTRVGKRPRQVAGGAHTRQRVCRRAGRAFGSGRRVSLHLASGQSLCRSNECT